MDTVNMVRWYRWYSSNDAQAQDIPNGSQSSFNDSGSSSDASMHEKNRTGTELIIIFNVMTFVLVASIILFINCRRRSYQQPDTRRRGYHDEVVVGLEMNGQCSLWDDDIIVAKRIPRDKVKVKKLLRRGAFGEVYSGVFSRQRVAVKMLLPSTRMNLQQVNSFLAEAKMTAIMDHPHIVNLVGVAWDSLSDLCVVLEFMDGGDLRELLNKYEASNHPTGFDRQKAMIALHVCHALTYLHSLSPPLIHRDLKSRNVLLSKTLEAKLTDFGISRERHDQTMTAGVGTSLWMAPEVMMGQRYGDKADMFSFGVVLSELDVHSLPYTQAKQRNREVDGRELTDTTLLQRVTTGEVRVDFSNFSPRSLVELGRACISLDPCDRPAAAEALYMLQMVIAKELHVSSYNNANQALCVKHDFFNLRY